MIERVVVASTGGWDFVSTRDRLGPIARRGPWPFEVVSARPIPTDAELVNLIANGGPEAVLLLQRIMPQSSAMVRMRDVYGAIVFDIDDAIHTVPPTEIAGVGEWGKRALRILLRGSPTASSRRRPLARTLRDVDVCVVGNEILGAFASRYAPEVTEIPTTAAPTDHPPDTRPRTPVLVWIGLPDNMHHLRIVRPALMRLHEDHDFIVRIVSSKPWEERELRMEHVPWSLEAESEALLASTVGLAPLSDDPWTRGKCARRAILCAAHALPVVASPVGMTDRVVLHGRTGFLARTPGEWCEALRRLLEEPELVDRMGRAGWEHIRSNYSDDVAASRWAEVLSSL